MKKQQKLQHQQPSRKSGRLSSSSPSTPIVDKAKPGHESRPADAWALSLDVVEQQPLSICYPSPEEEKSGRRSSRFTANKFTNPPPECIGSRSRSRKHAALGLSELKKSPRMLSTSSAPALTLTIGEDAGSVEAGQKKRRRLSVGKAVAASSSWGENNKSRRRALALSEPGSGSRSSGCLSERCLRSRKVLMCVGDGGNFKIYERRLRSRVVRYAVLDSPKALKKSVGSGERREKGRAAAKNAGDYALIAMPDVDESATLSRNVGEIPKLEMLPWHEKSPTASEKRSRSRTVKKQFPEERCVSVKSVSGVRSREKKSSVTPKKESSLGKSPAVLEKRDGQSEKQLRSRKVQRKENESVSGVGSREKKSSVTPKKESSLGKSPDVLEKREGQSEKQLRSRKIQHKENESVSGVRLREKKSSVTPKKESSLGKSPDVFEKREGQSEKRLRSRKIQLKESEDENENVVRVADPTGGGYSGKRAVKSEENENTLCGFVGEPVPEEVAHERWQWRYDLKAKKKGKNWKINADEEDEIILNVESHFSQAKVGNFVLNIGDCVFVKGEGKKKHIGMILEFFRTTEGEDYFRVQWFFRAEDTVLKDSASLHDKRRIFYSTLMNDNVLDCIISKVTLVKVPPTLCSKQNSDQSAAFYYDMEYSVDYSTFRTFLTETSMGRQSFLSNSKHPVDEPIPLTTLDLFPNDDSPKQELSLLDLYAGCGGMSTGLCLGAKLSSVNLVMRWAVDYNSSACESLKLNHPETNIRNESAEDFLELLKHWKDLCKKYACDIETTLKCVLEEPLEVSQYDTEEPTGEYEVSHFVDICYGDPDERGKRGLHFKVRWKGYSPEDDTWELAEGLSNCSERIQDFVQRGFNARILPLPGDVDVICGGPPCQGISGYNRYRNFDSPLDDERNRQIVVFMDIVEFLKPRYCLMENVVDIIRFDKGSLGRYALSRLVHMKYQARLGTIASGCYGLPQFRLRVFIWGAHPTITLPQFPLPTHDVVARYWPPIEFERNIVAYDEGQPRALEDAVVLRDSISDLPAVTNDESREEMEYQKPPETEFQRCIRLSKEEMMGQTWPTGSSTPRILYDHRPVKLSETDYLRVSQIPRRKGANFRDLPGVVVGEDNLARRDPTMEAVMLPTGRPLIPDCVFSHENGKSRKPYGRLWWDETVSTVVTYPHIRAQAVVHPVQDRLLTLRECARLQGFPDYYRFCGTAKERYCQIGNAVSIPVSRALGYALGVAHRNVAGDGPLMTLPPKFSSMLPPTDEKW